VLQLRRYEIFSKGLFYWRALYTLRKCLLDHRNGKLSEPITCVYFWCVCSNSSAHCRRRIDLSILDCTELWVSRHQWWAPGNTRPSTSRRNQWPQIPTKSPTTRQPEVVWWRHRRRVAPISIPSALSWSSPSQVDTGNNTVGDLWRSAVRRVHRGGTSRRTWWLWRWYTVM